MVRNKKKPKKTRKTKKTVAIDKGGVSLFPSD